MARSLTDMPIRNSPGKYPSHTVHVDDIAGAMWAAAEWMAKIGRKEADALAGEEIVFKNEKSKASEVEGMVQESGGSGEQLKKSRAMEKRKRELEERRKMLEAKRRKKNPDAEQFSVKAEEREHKVPVSPLKKVTSAQAPLDPFAALEVQASASRPDLKGKGKAK